MILFKPALRALALALTLSATAPVPVLAFRPKPPTLIQPSLATRKGDPATWSTFQECIAYLERWAGRDLPDWVVHSSIISYTTRRPLYDPDGSPRLDAAGNQLCEQVPVSGRVFFPPAWRLPSRPRLPLVIYTHATMLEKTQVPSEFGGHEWMLGAAAAAYYGFAVAMPDLPGMGGNSQNYHPFCHGKSLAYANLDALPALDRLAGEDAYLVRHGYGWDRRLYLLGYSAGGYGALATVRELEAHPGQYGSRFKFMGSACMAGPFDLSGTTRKQIIDPAKPFAHCFYLPYVIMAYHGIYGDLLDPLAAFTPALLEDREDGNVLQWTDGSMDGLEVDALIGRRLGVPGDAVVLRQTLNPEWVAGNLDEPAYATGAIRKLLQENDLCRGWRPTHPILFCQSICDQDVVIQNTYHTMEGLGDEIIKAGSDPSRFLAFLPIGSPTDRITHVEGALVAIPAAFNWIYVGMPME